MKAFVLVLFLAGCGFTPEGNALRAGVKEFGGQAYDEGLANAEWFTCDGASMGSVRRRYGRTKESAENYRRYCGDEGGVVLFEPATSK